MALDPDLCWRAYTSRDSRFAGRFVMGVTTTGIYCRPGCPARLPARRNTAFYASGAAAELEGFRPCRRCRPDQAPGSAAAAGTLATVQRALRLIDAGALDHGSVPALAERLGVTDRWLRELFTERLGAPPQQVAASRRAHLARRLLENPAARVADVALAAGYGSERRLRSELQRVFRASARALRGGGDAAPHHLLRLAARAPFDPRPTLAFLAARALPGAEEVGAAHYRRTVTLPGGDSTVVTVATRGDGVTLEAPFAVAAHLPALAARAARVFDLDADLPAVTAALRRDRRLAAALRGGAVRIPGAWDGYETAVRALLGQQVSVAAARTLAARLVARLGVRLARPVGTLTHAFPTPAALAAAPADALAMPTARAAAVRALAAAVAAGSLDLEGAMPPDAVRAALLALPGIGPWTADYIALRVLGDTDAWPASDLALRRALADRAGRRPSPREVERMAEGWRPWRGYALFALWRHDGARTHEKEA
jgi:AraC family transcriptional regulator of adaptative response / DNA-3-methyladenine glycosylase II